VGLWGEVIRSTVVSQFGLRTAQGYIDIYIV
jgi:hypothetical protein